MSVDVDTRPATAVPVRLQPGLAADLRAFGARDFAACFSCGTCTATCPLVDDDATFPRRLLRYGLLGLREDLLGSKELWTCYHCGLCTESCPQGADPAGFMAAARRYAIAGYDVTGLAGALYRRPRRAVALAVLVALVLGGAMLGVARTAPSRQVALFRFVPESTVHWTGVAAMVLVAAVLVVGVVSMVRGLARREGVTWKTLTAAPGRALAWSAAWSAVVSESLAFRRYRDDCAEEESARAPWWRRRWLVHGLTMWGFTGLLVATMADYGLSLVGLRATGTPEPVWYPVRLLGTLAGLAFLYGVSVLALNRLRRVERSVKTSEVADWLFLAVLWLVGLTGLVTELSLYVPGGATFGYGVFIAHVALALDLLVLLPFGKFAHVVYRPVALFFHALARARSVSGERTYD